LSDASPQVELQDFFGYLFEVGSHVLAVRVLFLRNRNMRVGQQDVMIRIDAYLVGRTERRTSERQQQGDQKEATRNRARCFLHRTILPIVVVMT